MDPESNPDTTINNYPHRYSTNHLIQRSAKERSTPFSFPLLPPPPTLIRQISKRIEEDVGKTRREWNHSPPVTTFHICHTVTTQQTLISRAGAHHRGWRGGDKKGEGGGGRRAIEAKERVHGVVVVVCWGLVCWSAAADISSCTEVRPQTEAHHPRLSLHVALHGHTTNDCSFEEQGTISAENGGVNVAAMRQSNADNRHSSGFSLFPSLSLSLFFSFFF